VLLDFFRAEKSPPCRFATSPKGDMPEPAAQNPGGSVARILRTHRTLRHGADAPNSFRGHRMDVGTLSFILCAVFARFLHNLPHRMNEKALSFILCRGNAGDVEEVISSQAGSSPVGLPFACLG
jgi:hypothetical protein